VAKGLSGASVSIDRLLPVSLMLGLFSLTSVAMSLLLVTPHKRRAWKRVSETNNKSNRSEQTREYAIMIYMNSLYAIFKGEKLYTASPEREEDPPPYKHHKRQNTRADTADTAHPRSRTSRTKQPTGTCTKTFPQIQCTMQGFYGSLIDKEKQKQQNTQVEQIS
jgi:hypothetical protein